MRTVSAYYLEGIRDGRASFKAHGMEFAAEEIATLERTLRGFDGSSPIGQMLRGELDFWRNQMKRKQTT